MILAGDIGGTKTNLALFSLENEKLQMQTQQQFASRKFASFNDVITAFAQMTNNPQITSACFGIAGPVINGRCRTTNLPWDITTSELQTNLGTRSTFDE